jgi:hypothetical protein
VIAVSTSPVNSNPALVQDYVCAELQGSRDMTGPQAAKYLAASRIVQAYQQTAQLLVSQGRLASVPSSAQIASHIDITFIKKDLAGDCPS